MKKNSDPLNHTLDIQDGDDTCYILIKYKLPQENGEIPIEMTYEGEKSLISYLLYTAQLQVDSEQDKECSSSYSNPDIHYASFK